MQRKAETPWRHAWNTRGQTEEAVCERGRPGVTWQGCRGETEKLTHRRNRRVGQSGRKHWGDGGEGR